MKPTWIEQKAYDANARLREARENQVYPYFREFEQGGIHTSVAGKPLHWPNRSNSRVGQAHSALPLSILPIMTMWTDTMTIVGNCRS
jgi:hypothetical protein